MENFNHAIKESVSMERLRLHTLPKRQFDPNEVAYNFEQSFEWERVNLSPGDFGNLQEFRNRRLEIILIHLLKIEDKPTPSVTVNSEGPSSHIES